METVAVVVEQGSNRLALKGKTVPRRMVERHGLSVYLAARRRRRQLRATPKTVAPSSARRGSKSDAVEE